MDPALAGFDALTRTWFHDRFGAVTEPQRLGWPEIQAGRDVLISAPTGSGKTLAAFLTSIDGLVRQARTGALPDRTQVLYVSPLKALAADVARNLDRPIADMALPITVATRSGDTSSEARRRQREAPHRLPRPRG